MTTYKPAVRPEHDAPALQAAVSRYLDRFPGIGASMERMRRRYAKHLVPLDELRSELDEALGERSLTAELYKMRGKW
jgi:hypothetical protein